MWLQKRVLCVAQKLNCVTLARAHFRSLGFAGAHMRVAPALLRVYLIHDDALCIGILSVRFSTSE